MGVDKQIILKGLVKAHEEKKGGKQICKLERAQQKSKDRTANMYVHCDTSILYLKTAKKTKITQGKFRTPENY